VNEVKTESKRMAPAVLPVDLHKWLKREAFERETSITAESTEAVELLRQQRAAETVTAGGQAVQP